jgi:hypothetical protein
MYAERQQSCQSVQAIALQQGTCEKDTDNVRRLEGVPPT